MANDIKREWFETDYYAVLGVSKGAAQADVTKAYRKLARQYHPDTNPGNDPAEERFKEISTAYDVVGDEEKRASYDEARSIGPGGGGFTGSGRTSNGGFGFEGVDMGDLLGSVFGGGGADGGGLFGDQPGGRYGRMKRPGRDQEARLSISFGEAMSGTTASVSLTDGAGKRTIKVRIPTGVESGQRIRLRGKGGPGEPQGDLYVIIDVGSHVIFGRRGAKLTLDLPVTIAEASLGAEVRVPTYTGESVTVRIPAGTQHGRTLRVRGAGVVGEDDKIGDLLVIISIAVPKNLSKKQSEALQAFADLDDDSPRAHLEASD
jgi:molecular chaperone DnaJ